MSPIPALLLDLSVKAILLWLAGAIVAAAARRGSAALRHDVWLAVIGGCALLPLAVPLARLASAVLTPAPVHDAVMAITPNLPAAVPVGTIELVDRIWSGDGGMAGFGLAATLLALAWFAGFAAVTFGSGRARRAAAAIVRRATPFNAAGAPGDVRVLMTPEVATPALFGVRAPAILLPAAAADWPAERLRAIFAHETAHVARRDCALDLVVQLACAIHWFNPFVWRAARALRAERELACDAQALAGGLDPAGYASELVAVARNALGGPRSALLAMARPNELERRILLLLGPRRLAHGRGGARGAFAWATAALFMVFATLTAPAAGVLASGSVQPGDGVLRRLDDPMSERVPLDYERLAARAAALPAVGPDAAAIAALKTELHRGSHGYGDLVRERAIWALSEARDGRLFEGLAEHVADDDWRLRAYAAWGMAAIADRRATRLLVGLLEDPVWRVRAMAAAALAEIADPAAAAAMTGALDDPAWQVRIGAANYLGRLGDAALARRALTPLLRDPHPATRLQAEEVLARF